MAHIELQAQSRTLIGNQARKLRREGVIPAVIFSKEHLSENIQVIFSDFYKVFKQAGKNHVIDVLLNDKKVPVIVDDIDVHPVKGLPRHISFLAVNLKQKVTASVPVVLTGEAAGVKEQGAVLIQDLEEIEVSALPDNIPGEIVIDITHLAAVGDHVLVEQLKVEGDYTFVTEMDQVVATLVAQSKEEDFESSNETVIEGESDTESNEEVSK
jgi:large subunit ribosomal protein L25